MQFLNPKILYALFLLLIPILIHLFQLRRFQKTAFTNVVVLKQLNQSTRKSQKLKKWLILATRLLGLACLIIAFAKPFIPNNNKATLARETVLFLDNSFSMQAKGAKGTLLTEAIQDLITHFPNNTPFTLLTHDQVFKNIMVDQNRDQLLDISYSSTLLSAETIRLKVENSFSPNQQTVKEFILVSDFQNIESQDLINKNLNQNWVKLTPTTIANIAIDHVAIDRVDNDFKLTTYLKSNTSQQDALAVSLYNGNKLTAKGSVDFNKNLEASTSFQIPSTASFNGKLNIIDPNLSFDNTFYFTINSPKAIQVLSINQTSSDAFLSRLFPPSEFSYTSVQLKNLAYNTIEKQQVIILNEIAQLPEALINVLKAFTTAGGQLIFIPNATAKASAYDRLLTTFGFQTFKYKTTGNRLIASINYEHPLYAGVFTKKVNNLNYHTVTNNFNFSANDIILSLDDGKPFLAKKGNLFVFTAAINTTNSNFQNGELIVPTFYKMAIQALTLPQISYTLGNTNSFDIQQQITGDAVITLAKDDREYIPLQKRQGNKVTITTGEGITQDGIYELRYQKDMLGSVAFNYNREESILTAATPDLNGITAENSLAGLLEKLQEAQTLNLLYKWFIIFALLFFLMEMLILKFLK